MSEEEKEAIEQLRSWRKYIIEHREIVNKANDIEFYLRTALNLIENQQKELNSLKEIEKSHKEENGKLRVELEQYKLLEANIDKANKIIAENKFDEGLYGLLMQEKEKNKELEDKQIWSKGRIEELKKELEQEKNKINYEIDNCTTDLDTLTALDKRAIRDLENNTHEIEQHEVLTIIREFIRLRNDYKQEKEKNKDLQKQLNGAFDRGFISKDKIKEKIEQAEQKADDDNLDEYTKISAWKELLEEV